jgi:NAD(P)-dependent dehydrogenase (short-subunit alcohol dehydrogenase family)
MGAYGATKHAVVGMAGALREELRGAGVRVSVVCPGLVRTRIFESERNRPPGGAEAHSDPAMATSLLALIDHGVDPADIADAVLAGVFADRLFVIPTSDVTGMVTARLDEVRAALPAE